MKWSYMWPMFSGKASLMLFVCGRQSWRWSRGTPRYLTASVCRASTCEQPWWSGNSPSWTRTVTKWWTARSSTDWACSWGSWSDRRRVPSVLTRAVTSTSIPDSRCTSGNLVSTMTGERVNPPSTVVPCLSVLSVFSSTILHSRVGCIMDNLHPSLPLLWYRPPYTIPLHGGTLSIEFSVPRALVLRVVPSMMSLSRCVYVAFAVKLNTDKYTSKVPIYLRLVQVRVAYRKGLDSLWQWWLDRSHGTT